MLAVKLFKNIEFGLASHKMVRNHHKAGEENSVDKGMLKAAITISWQNKQRKDKKTGKMEELKMHSSLKQLAKLNSPIYSTRNMINSSQVSAI